MMWVLVSLPFAFLFLYYMVVILNFIVHFGGAYNQPEADRAKSRFVYWLTFSWKGSRWPK